MVKNNKKPRSISALAATIEQGSGANSKIPYGDLHRARIARLGVLKQSSKNMEQYIYSLIPEIVSYPSPATPEGFFQIIADRMAGCGHYLLFRDYYTLGEVKLVKARTCQIHLLCPFCAHNRAAKQVRAYVQKLDVILKEKPRLKLVFITLTVKNGADLAERFNHLHDSFQTMNNRRKDWIKKGRGFNEFCKLKGAVFSYEVTYNDRTGEYHPHIHIIALADQWIDRDALSNEWFDVTEDSNVIDVRRIRKVNGGYGEAFCEVFKYALKFSSMSHDIQLGVYLTLSGKRLVGVFGLFRGVKVDESILDDPIKNQDIPYLEILYQFANNQGYSVTATKNIDPSDQGASDQATPTRPSKSLVKYKYADL